MVMWVYFFCSSRRRHTRCALVTGVQTCALPISTFRKLPMLAMIMSPLMIEPASLRPRWHEKTGAVRRRTEGRSDSVGPPEGQFLAPRGMAAKPTGEESVRPAVAAQPVEASAGPGQVSHLSEAVRSGRHASDCLQGGPRYVRSELLKRQVKPAI